MVPVATRILNGLSDGSFRRPNSVARFRKQEVNKPPVGFLYVFSLPQHILFDRVFRFLFAFALPPLPTFRSSCSFIDLNHQIPLRNGSPSPFRILFSSSLRGS